MDEFIDKISESEKITVDNFVCGDNQEWQYQEARKTEDYKWHLPANARGKSLLQAYKTINGERQDKHGKPEDSFRTIAEFWNTYITAYMKRHGKTTPDLGEAQVCEMMNLLKVARMTGQGDNPDNQRDGAGYLALAADFRAKEQYEPLKMENECLNDPVEAGLMTAAGERHHG